MFFGSDTQKKQKTNKHTEQSALLLNGSTPIGGIIGMVLGADSWGSP